MSEFDEIVREYSSGGLDVLEWSQSQGCFHCNKLERALETNCRNESRGHANSYVIIGTGESLDQVSDLAHTMQEDREKKPGIWVLEWNGETGKYRYNTFMAMIEDNRRDYYKGFSSHWIPVTVGSWEDVWSSMRARNARGARA